MTQATHTAFVLLNADLSDEIQLADAIATALQVDLDDGVVPAIEFQTVSTETLANIARDTGPLIQLVNGSMTVTRVELFGSVVSAIVIVLPVVDDVWSEDVPEAIAGSVLSTIYAA